VRAVILLPLLTASLRLRGFRSTQHFLQRFLTSAKNAAENGTTDFRIQLTSRMVLAAARNSLFPSTCLERSLALWWLLAQQGITSQFRIGVRKDAEKFAAHAWVERDGVAIGEPEASHMHYAAFAEEMSGGNP
jgi:hypothetical protein